MDKIASYTWKETRYKTTKISVNGNTGYIHYNYITNRYEIVLIYGNEVLTKNGLSKVGINVLMNKSDDDIIKYLKNDSN